jgi:proliferating cell nuclear antigen
MFEIMSKDLKTIKGVFEAISAVVSEAKMKFTPNGIFLDAIDEGRICLIGMKLDKDDFDTYKCSDTYELGINMEDVTKILRRGTAKEEITLVYNPDIKKIKILLKAEKSKKARQFGLGLIQLGDTGIKPEALDKIEYTSKISIPLSYLEEAIKDADIFSECLILSINKENMMFKAEGQIGESETVLESGDEGIQDFTCGVETGDNTFALAYLKNIVKVSAISDRVELSINAGTPMKAKFLVMSSSLFKYYLAPRIDEQEEDYDEANSEPVEEKKAKKTSKVKKSSKKEEEATEDEEEATKEE